MKKSQLYPVIGFLFGWGRRPGAMLRYILSEPASSAMVFVSQEWSGHSFYYWYMMIGTCLVGTLAGYFLGRAEDASG